MILALTLMPLAAAAIVWFMKPGLHRARVLPVAGVLHLALVLLALTRSFQPQPDAWLRLDPLGGWMLLVVSTIFTLCSLYAPAYLALRMERNFGVFGVSMLGFLGMASLVATSRHPGVLWVGMETTALATTPLLYYNKNKRSLEATWKYLLICSVGMALALLGTFFVAYAAQQGGLGEPIYIDRLVANARAMPVPWLKAGFVLLLVGYGTKMGLAPMHTWKPDAYGETPGIVGTILAGGVTTMAFLSLLRFFSIMAAAGLAGFCRELLVAMGLVSMAWAFVFMIRQGDLRRLLAYSSVEHMGILAFGVGIGGKATLFALFHVAANALVKSVLFLGSGNIVRSFSSKSLADVSGAMRRLPVSGWCFLLGFLAIVGSPPFAPFTSIFGIASTALGGGHLLAGSLFLALLAAIFTAMGSVILPVLQGNPNPPSVRTHYEDTFGLTFPLVLALALALILGTWLPGPLHSLLTKAALLVEGQA
ncbi:proton-conducting transporter transmembrane domain-containing protein [Mesoterricola silvestris]|uniref:Hydrogenase n=1 Tax=Mesoterricola silvestris TaxID=2927979 RepID=A0AA48GI20_9BACT|nr:proton-conducting transporter membrane subunit [Mesoterricola silvestris]BDU71637.1 hydrogenase [Mesoterricola silvestris]